MNDSPIRLSAVAGNSKSERSLFHDSPCIDIDRIPAHLASLPYGPMFYMRIRRAFRAIQASGRWMIAKASDRRFAILFHRCGFHCDRHGFDRKRTPEKTGFQRLGFRSFRQGEAAPGIGIDPKTRCPVIGRLADSMGLTRGFFRLRATKDIRKITALPSFGGITIARSAS